MKNSSKTNKKVLNELALYFYPNSNLNNSTYLDFMGAEFNSFNPPTIHHIVKASTLREKNESDAATIDNAAILGDISHQLLHQIELIDKDLYDEWNDLFLRINQSRKEFYDDFKDEILDLQFRSRLVLEEYEERKSSKHKK